MEKSFFVDDSDDDTPARLQEKPWPMPVKVIARPKDQRQGGLSTAVMEGISNSSGQYIGVMDADLQHPPEVIPTLLETAKGNDDDIVIASRFTKGGGLEGLANPGRKIA